MGLWWLSSRVLPRGSRYHLCSSSQPLGFLSTGPDPATRPTSLAVRVTSQNVQEVVFASPVPVILDCYADWCEPCKKLTPLLEKAAAATEGRVRLATLNVDAEQELAGKLQVRSLPTVFGVFAGRVVDSFTGAAAEPQLVAFIEQLLKAGANYPPGPAADDVADDGADDGEAGGQALARAAALLEEGDPVGAATLYKEAYSGLMAEPPRAPAAAGEAGGGAAGASVESQQVLCLIGLASCAHASGDTRAVSELLKAIKTKHAHLVAKEKSVAAAVAQLEFANEAALALDGGAEEPGLGGLEQRLAEAVRRVAALDEAAAAGSSQGAGQGAGQSEDEAGARARALGAVLEARCALARALFQQAREAEAVDQALLVVKGDRSWNDGAGKKLVVQFIEALGPDHPAVKPARRRLANFLFS
mmetsp:Transcript_28431/g.63475  ORF Transcript_28431/g.63475 Transcript_28431/m.63475 type:complete len:417 (-) Transcript_28431:377-1627(-)